jgi:YD repeat-containing protein
MAKRTFNSRALRKLVAAHNLSQHPGIAARDREAFAASVAKQWRLTGGHACLFLGGERQMVLTLTEGADGGCAVEVTIWQASFANLLSSLGFSAHDMPDVIARINVGQEVEFRDRDGFPSAVWYDPAKRRIAIPTYFPPLPGSASRGTDHPRGDLS